MKEVQKDYLSKELRYHLSKIQLIKENMEGLSQEKDRVPLGVLQLSLNEEVLVLREMEKHSLGLFAESLEIPTDVRDMIKMLPESSSVLKGKLYINTQGGEPIPYSELLELSRKGGK